MCLAPLTLIFSMDYHKSRSIILISKSLFLFLDLNSHFKIILINLMLRLSAVPQFILCQKQTIVALL